VSLDGPVDARDGRPPLTRQTLPAGARGLIFRSLYGARTTARAVTLTSRVLAQVLALDPSECKTSPAPAVPVRRYLDDMTDQAPEQPEQTEWPTHCPVCGTALASAVIDFDKTNADRNELQPGEMVAVDYCPNPDCPAKRGPA
jgi:hypothetical protein